MLPYPHRVLAADGIHDDIREQTAAFLKDVPFWAVVPFIVTLTRPGDSGRLLAVGIAKTSRRIINNNSVE
jgi:hypothetical protein